MIFIPFNVPSLKNSKNPITLPGRDYTTLAPSKTVRKYLQKIGVKNYHVSLSKKKIEAGMVKIEEYKTRPNLFRESVGNYFYGCRKPVVVKFHFVRDTKRKFDFHNAVQIIADLLVAHDFIEDDDMSRFIPVPMYTGGKWYDVDKNNPGVWVKII